MGEWHSSGQLRLRRRRRRCELHAGESGRGEAPECNNPDGGEGGERRWGGAVAQCHSGGLIATVIVRTSPRASSLRSPEDFVAAVTASPRRQGDSQGLVATMTPRASSPG
ncbi:unnamed protein product [Lampetra planeri]